MTDWIEWVLNQSANEAETAESWAEAVEWVTWTVGAGSTAEMADTEYGERRDGKIFGWKSERKGTAAGKWTSAAGEKRIPAGRVTERGAFLSGGQGHAGSGTAGNGGPSKIISEIELAEESERAAGLLADAARRRAVAEYAGRRRERQGAPVVVRVESVAETGTDATVLDQIFQRDARRYDGGFSLY